MESFEYNQECSRLATIVNKIMVETGLEFPTVFRREFRKSAFPGEMYFMVKSNVWVRLQKIKKEERSVVYPDKIDMILIYLTGSEDMSREANEGLCPVNQD